MIFVEKVSLCSLIFPLNENNKSYWCDICENVSLSLPIILLNTWKEQVFLSLSRVLASGDRGFLPTTFQTNVLNKYVTFWLWHYKYQCKWHCKYKYLVNISFYAIFQLILIAEICPPNSNIVLFTLFHCISKAKQDWKAFQSSWERKKWQFFP